MIITGCEQALSAEAQSDVRGKVNEILRPYGLDGRLLVALPAKSIALYFGCLMLSAVMSLRDQWNSGQLRDIVQSLFTFLSGSTQTVRVKRLSWPLTDYERCLRIFRCMQGNNVKCHM